MPRFTPLQRFSRNIYQFVIFFLIKWPRSNKFRTLLKEMENCDVLHFNHISLSFLAWWCKLKKIGKKRTMHIRTMPPKNFFSKTLYQISSYSCKAFIYITENEKNYLHELINQPPLFEKVIHNPVKLNHNITSKLLEGEKRFKIGILSSFSYERGIDRVLEIFLSIPKDKRHKFVFVIAGDMTLEKNIPNFSKKLLSRSKYFYDYIRHLGIEKNFIFLGQVNKPEEVLQNINVLLKPTRLNNPWGRDILEALSYGKPVISVGTYNKFVDNNKTGLLQSHFNAKEIANWLIKLQKSTSFQKKFNLECKSRIYAYCFPKKVSQYLLNAWIKN